MIIIGTGAVAAEITMFFPDQVDGYLEYDYNIEKYYDTYKYSKPVIGDVDNYKICLEDQFICAIANIDYKKIVIKKIKDRGGKFINFVHQSAIVSPDLEMGEGNIICPQCIIDPNVRIGSYNLFTAQTAISHDSVIGDNNFMSSVVIDGHVTIGNDNFFGTHSCVIPDKTIGSGNVIAAGVSIRKNIRDNMIIFNRPQDLIITPNERF